VDFERKNWIETTKLYTSGISEEVNEKNDSFTFFYGDIFFERACRVGSTLTIIMAKISIKVVDSRFYF